MRTLVKSQVGKHVVKRYAVCRIDIYVTKAGESGLEFETFKSNEELEVEGLNTYIT